MTLSPSVSRIVDILVPAGFRTLPTPFKIGSIPFEFAAMLVGTDKSSDLVVVIDTVTEKEERARQKITGLGRALDAVQSRRPVTAIITGPTPGGAVLESIARVCRVLPVGTPTGPSDDQLLMDWLSIPLPLEVPDTSTLAADPLADLRNQSDKLGSLVVGAAARGAGAVQNALRERLEGPLSTALDEMSDSAGDGA